MQLIEKHIVYYDKDLKDKIHSRRLMLLGVQMKFNKIILRYLLGFDFSKYFRKERNKDLIID